MKKANETSKKADRNLDLFISEISEVAVLNYEEMSAVRGGDDTGGDPIVEKPKF